MKTYLDCIPCFFRQALEAARLSGVGVAKQKKILDEVGKNLSYFSLNSPPPQMAKVVHSIVKKVSKKQDPYLKIKQKSNKLALSIYPKLVRKVFLSQDRFFTAVKLAVAGNVIDYGVKNSLNIEEELRRILAEENDVWISRDRRFFEYKKLKRLLKKAKLILYLADNAGETVFDKVLIEEIKRIYPDKEVVYATKDKPIINDALISDACRCGIDKIAKVISSGSDAPGTILKLCSSQFLKFYKNADLIISKGQGNFEALFGEDKPIFFLFMAKCPVVADEIGCRVGQIVLISSRVGKRR